MRKILIAVATGALVAGGAVLGAAPAQAYEVVVISPGSAAQVWHQSFQRPSEDAPCNPPAALDIPWQAAWPQDENTWAKSWEQWPNGGTGGWTCTRSITWAQGSPAVYMSLA